MIRVLIVDDEAPARAHLARLLEAEPSVLLVGSAANGPEALEKIEELHPDVVFLDIEMPAMNGFEVLRHMTFAPLVVFATAYDEFAVKAFDANALDYILKPVQAQRIKQTVERINALMHSGGTEYRDSMRDVLNLMEKERGAPPTKIAARRGKRFILLALPEILHITIDDKLVFAHTVKEKFLVEKTVSEVEQTLADCGFRRISRGTLVNMEHVRELLPWFSGTWKLKLSTGEELDVSRDRARSLTDAMGI